MSTKVKEAEVKEAEVKEAEVKEAEVKEAEVKEAEVKEAEVKEAEVKAPKTPEVKKVDITPVVNAIPETFTPALLDKLFNLNDGGKTVRRHLRKNFAEPVAHAHKEKWTFTKTANADILQYFADRYSYDLKVLETA